MSPYHFTKDELVDVGEDYVLVEWNFWANKRNNGDVQRELMRLVPLCLPASYKFVYEKDGVEYPLTGEESTSSYGPVYIADNQDVQLAVNTWDLPILAMDMATDKDPNRVYVGGYRCILLKKVYPKSYNIFTIKKGGMAVGSKLKIKSQNGADGWIIGYDDDSITYRIDENAIKSTNFYDALGFKQLSNYTGLRVAKCIFVDAQ